MEDVAAPHLHVLHLELVLAGDEEALVVGLAALLGVEAGAVQEDAALLSAFYRVDELFVVADGEDLAGAGGELVSAEQKKRRLIKRQIGSERSATRKCSELIAVLRIRDNFEPDPYP